MNFRALTVLALLVPLVLAVQARAATLAQGPLSVVLPDSVGEGDPFLVEVRLAGQARPVRVEWMGRSVDVVLSRKGDFCRGEVLLGAGLGCQHGVQPIRVEAAGAGVRETLHGGVLVKAVAFPEQRLNVEPRMVTPSKENLARIKREQELIRSVLAGPDTPRGWGFPFQRPVPGVVTSAFGLRRVFNGQPRNPHTGLDLQAGMGETVLAANRGKVILTGDFYFNGKSVFIDHGQGVISMYFHLSRVDVAEGQQVERGGRVGLAGASGRATGPHLHFGMKILGQTVDPTPLFTTGSASNRQALGGS